VRHRALATEVRHRQDRPAPSRLHQRLRRTGARDQRVRADVERDPESFARRLDERIRQLVLLRELGGVDEKVQPAEFLVERRGQIGDLLIVGNVARREQRILELLCELADVFLEPFARIRQRETRAFGRRRASPSAARRRV